jgi:hypothetical protein
MGRIIHFGGSMTQVGADGATKQIDLDLPTGITTGSKFGLAIRKVELYISPAIMIAASQNSSFQMQVHAGSAVGITSRFDASVIASWEFVIAGFGAGTGVLNIECNRLVQAVIEDPVVSPFIHLAMRTVGSGQLNVFSAHVVAEQVSVDDTAFVKLYQQ